MSDVSRRRATDADVVGSGPDAWERLRLACAAGRELSRQLELVRRLRDQAMAQLHAGGASYQTIAVAAGMTRGRVAQIVRASGEDRQQ
jgi:hypothetical protein